jgi:hypothetical protein
MLQLRRNKFLPITSHPKSWVADNGSITSKNHGTETRTLPFRRSGSVSPYNDILVDIFGDRIDSWCRHTRAAVLIAHAYTQSSEGSAI